MKLLHTFSYGLPVKGGGAYFGYIPADSEFVYDTGNCEILKSRFPPDEVYKDQAFKRIGRNHAFNEEYQE